MPFDLFVKISTGWYDSSALRFLKQYRSAPNANKTKGTSKKLKTAIKANMAIMNKMPPFIQALAFLCWFALNASKSNPQLGHFDTTRPIGALHCEQEDMNNSTPNPQIG